MALAEGRDPEKVAESIERHRVPPATGVVAPGAPGVKWSGYRSAGSLDGAKSKPCYAPRAAPHFPALHAGYQRSPIPRDRAVPEHVDHAVVDRNVRRILRTLDVEIGDQRPCGAAVGGDHRVLVEGPAPRAHPRRDLGIGLAAGRPEAPFVAFALGDDILVAREHVLVGQAFPFAEGDLDQPLVDCVALGWQPQRRAHQVHGLAGAAERARDVAQFRGRPAVAFEQVAQDLAAGDGLQAALGVERHVVPALQPVLGIPVGEAVADVVDDGRGHGRTRDAIAC